MQECREIIWVTAARRDFKEFPEGARRICLHALTIVAGGDTPAIVKAQEIKTPVHEIELIRRQLRQVRGVHS